MIKPSLLETLATDISGNAYIDSETTQTIIRDIAADLKRKIAKAEEQSSVLVQENRD